MKRLSPVGTGRSIGDDITPNLLAFTVAKQLQTVVDALADASPHLDPQRNCGIEPVRTRDGSRWRQSTDAECHMMTVDLVDYRLIVDARKPIPAQVAAWLREVSAELLATADTIEGFDDDCDLTPPTKPRGPRKAALVASLAGLLMFTGCCQSPPAAVQAPAPIDAPAIRRQSQSTITIHDGPNSQSVNINTNGGGNVTSRVTVGPDGKLIVEEIEVGPVR